MVRFVRYWIERSMEDPEAREEKARKHMEQMAAGAEVLIKRWAQPPKPPGYWMSKSATSTTTERVAQAKADILSPYERLLDDMDAAKKAAADK